MNSKHAYDMLMQAPECTLAEVSAPEPLKFIHNRATVAIEAFLQDPTDLRVKSPEAHSYDFQSHGVVGMLQKLIDFIDERTKVEKE